MTPFEIAAAIILALTLVGLVALEIAHRRWRRVQDDIEG